MKTLLALIMLVLTTQTVQAQYVEARVERGSAIMIDGTSSVNSFTCTADDVDGRATLRGAASPAREADVVVVVPVRDFDCGKKRMNSDMHSALKADRFPAIIFELDQASVEEGGRQGQSLHELDVQGRISLAGAERTISLPVRGRLMGDGTFRVTGEVQLQMTDFGISPPTALLGLVQAHNDILVRFDIRASVNGDILAQNR